MRIRTFATYAATLTATLAAILLACNQGSEGDRCNPDLSHDECGDNLTCTIPPLCPEAYCCPTDSSGNLLPNSNPYCQTGCNGGAASACNAGADDAGQCAFACKNDPGDLLNSSVCSEDGGTEDAGTDSGTDSGADAGQDSGGGSSDGGDSGDNGPGGDAGDGGDAD